MRSRTGLGMGLTAVVVALTCAGMAWGETVYWTGGASTGWANSGNWTNAAGANKVPAAADDVVIDVVYGGSTTNHPTLDLSGGATNIQSLTLGVNSTSILTVANGDVTSKKLVVAGNVSVGGLGTLTHPQGNETHRLFLDVGGSLTIASGGKIEVTGKGFAYGQGPGGAISYGGAGHGGQGGFGYQTPQGGSTYGSITNPVRCGSGGMANPSTGGGAVILQVAGALTNNGMIVANGQINGQQSGAAGGSINITAAHLAGGGTISANGGNAFNGSPLGGGGGGRVALVLTSGDSTEFASLSIQAFGGAPSGGGYGAAGTVYLKAVGNTYGDLRVDNSNRVTDAMTVFTANTNRFDTILTTNQGAFAAGTNGVLDLTGCVLSSDSRTNNITSRVILGIPGSTVVWPAAYTNTGTLSMRGTNVYAATMDLTVAPGAILTHDANVGDPETHKLNLALTGNLTIAAGGAIDVTARGFSNGNGPGTKYNGGAGYGGQGGAGYQVAEGGVTYGSVTNPIRCGSGGGGIPCSGGGAVILQVTGAVTNNGTITANGQGTGGSGGGAGGSINITAAHIAGGGTLSANGAPSLIGFPTGGGGGGRIAVVLTNGNSTECATLTFQAVGGAPSGGGYGAAGTIYLKGNNQSYGALLVDNASYVTTVRALLGTNVTGTTVGDVVLRNGGYVSLPAGQVLTTYGNWSNALATNALSGTGTVVFAGATTNTLYGSTTFAIFICTNAGKTLRFEAGKTNVVTAGLRLTGASGNLITLESTDPAAPWYFRAQPGSSQDDVSYLSVSNSNASAGNNITAKQSQDKGGNVNWTFSNPAPVTWTGGAGSTLWTATANWDLGRPPLADDPSITIAPATYQPALDIDHAFSGALIVQSGATLTLNGKNLTIAGAVTSAGALIATGSETLTLQSNVDFTGGSFTAAASTIRLAATAGTQAFTPNGNTFYNMEVPNAITLRINNGFTAALFKCRTAGAQLTCNAGSTYAVTDLNLVGALGTPVTLRSSTPGTQWYLNVSRLQAVHYVDVQDSNASGGRTIYAIESTGNSVSNPNWDFGSGKAWTGTDTTWNTSGNWSPAGVPGAANYVLIDGSAAGVPRLTAATTIGGLAVAGLGGPAVLNVNMPFAGPDRLTVTGNVEVGTSGTLTHSQGNESQRLSLAVGGNLIVTAGGAIDVSAKGYSAGSGPGTKGNGGAGHGGQGGSGYNAPVGGLTYGAIVNPVRCGSGGMANPSSGGGVVILQVTGSVTNNGMIAANGQTNGEQSGAAGGSVNITAAHLAGGGTISANGGNAVDAYPVGGGGGGRVAIVLTGGASTEFASLAIGASGGAPSGGDYGAAGTVYLQTPAQGVVTVNNSALTSAARTQIPPFTNAVPDELKSASVVVTNFGAVGITTNVSLRTLSVISTNEKLEMGAAGTRLTLLGARMTINGTVYTRGGLYTVADWRGLPTPVNVSGAGEILIQVPVGTVLTVR